MASKQIIKLSEAKIIAILDENRMIQKKSLMRFKYARGIAELTKMEYSYVINLLKQMRIKEWIKVDMKRGGKVFYKLTKKCPSDEADKLITDKIEETRKWKRSVNKKWLSN